MSMTEFHRKILEKVAPDFLNDLDSEDIVPYLVADEAISRHDREKIYTKGTRREKVAALLDILPRRGDGAYISLLSSLTKTDGSKHLYEITKKHEQWVSDQLQQELKEEKPPLQDDTGNNEGNDDQLTSLKQDSGSNQDDITFGGLSAPPEILARGRRARRAYAEAAQAGTKKVFRTRLMLVGQERVGKTSLKKILTGQGFEATTDGVETNDCEISIEVAKAGGRLWSIDKREDEYNKALAEEIAKRLVVTPPQDQESLESTSDSNGDRGINPDEADFVLDNVEAPKAKEEDDNMPNQIASLVEKMLKEQVHLKEKGTDSTDSGRGERVSLSIWDFAGRDVYYTTHQVFLTWRAIYVVVFDLSRSLDSVVPPESRDEYYEMVKGGAKSELTCLEFINFWLCSIFAHAVAPSSVRSKNTSKRAQISPPIFIVGTHRESVKGDAKEKREKIGSAFKKIRQSIMKRPFECQVVPKYYAIENSLEDKDEELVALRRHIEKVAMEEPYMGEEIPLRWLLFEEALAADKINYMSLDQTKKLAQPVGIKSERELLTMLTFYHDLGYVVYYGGIEDQQSLLQDMVILNPQWLIDVFKQVITILDPAKRDGILEDRLIQHMWQGFLEQKEALVQLMAKFDLICEAPVERLQQEPQDGVDTEVSNETAKVIKKRYYVPSRLTSPYPPEKIALIKSSTDFYVDFRGFLPDGLFHRLMTRAVRWMGERNGEPVNLFYRHISLMVDEEHHALLWMLPPHEATIKVIVFRGAVANYDDDGDIHQPPAPSVVKEVMDFVTSTLDSLRQHWAKRIQYDVCFLCPKCSKKKLFRDCFKRKSLQCGLHRIRTAAVKSKFGMSEEGLESGNMSPVMPRRSKDEYNNALADERLVVTPLAQDQESLEPHSDTTACRGLNPVEAEDFVLDNVEAPKAKEEDDNMPNQIANLVEKMLEEQVHLKDEESLEPHSDTTPGRGLNPVEADDTGNNEGNDQLTSLQQDSGSNQDDSSFAGLSAPPEILARGPRARQAYAEAAQAGTKKIFRTRLMLVGQERVGKTSLKKTLTGQGFDQNEAMTDGVETTCEISIQVVKTGGKMWSIHKKGHGNDNTKEDEYNNALADEIAKRLVVTPSQDEESLEPHSDTTPGRDLNPVEAEDFVLDNVEVPKAKEEDDNMPNQIASLVEKMLEEQFHLKEKETDSTDSGRGERVSFNIWDFAGHDVYYTTHQVFLTWRAIYVIVFDLSRSLDSDVPLESRNEYYDMAKGDAKSELTCLEFINFWLCSIYAHAVAPSSVKNHNTSETSQIPPPTIFIVGTHRDSVKGDAKEKEKEIASAFQKIHESIKKKPFHRHVESKYYAIESNLEDKDEDEKLIALKRHIEKVAMKEPYMGNRIPLRWLLFERYLATVDIKYMSLDQVKEVTQPFGIESKCELLTMLTFYHDLGYVVYYGDIEDQHSLLRDMVILNPQWLIDVFKQVITVLDHAKRRRIVSDAWTTLEEDGILEDRLIQHMWQGFLDQKEALVEIMDKFDLICEAPVEQVEPQDGLDTEVSNETEKVVKTRYYVPSRLPPHCSPKEIAEINKSSTDFYVDFRGFLTDGLFHRLMTRAVRWMGERDGEPVDLYYRHISIMVDEEHHALLEMLPPREATIKVTVFQGAVANSDHNGDSPKPPAPCAVKEVKDFVERTLDDLIRHWARRIEYDICFLCPKCSKKTLLKDCFKRKSLKSLKCGEHRIDTDAVKLRFGLTEAALENRNSTSPRPSPFTSVDTSPQGASAAVSEVSTSTTSTVSDMEFLKLAQDISPSYYNAVGISLGIPCAKLQAILGENVKNYANAFLVVFMKWNVKQPLHSNKRQLLADKLREIDLDGLSDRFTE